MLVPDGWTATESDGTYELTSESRDGAIHVTSYKRRGGPIGDDEVKELVAGFVDGTGATEPVEIEVLREDESQHRAVTRFTVDSDNATTAWLVFAVLWPQRLVMCSCTAQPGAPALDEAEQMFASIFPPQKGWFRRR